MAILKLKPACKDYIWGGRRLIDEYNKPFEGERLAETWEMSCHPDGPSVIVNGEHAGKSLAQFVEEQGKGCLGSNCQIFQDFPIMIKFIDAKDNLSIQVHPNNIYALEKEHQYGKTEVWYVLDCGPDAFLYYGFKEAISQEEFRERIANNTLLEVLNAVPVHKGDVFYIPAGTIHAICRDIVIAEIQQSSNVTYRVYDYGRVGADGKPRQLHVEQAVQVTKLAPPKDDYNFGGHLVRSPYFTVDQAEGAYEGVCDDESFTSVLVVDGDGTISCGDEKLAVTKGDSLFLPADSGKFTLDGSAKVLITRVGTI